MPETIFVKLFFINLSLFGLLSGLNVGSTASQGSPELGSDFGTLILRVKELGLSLAHVVLKIN